VIGPSRVQRARCGGPHVRLDVVHVHRIFLPIGIGIGVDTAGDVNLLTRGVDRSAVLRAHRGHVRRGGARDRVVRLPRARQRVVNLHGEDLCAGSRHRRAVKSSDEVDAVVVIERLVVRQPRVRVPGDGVDDLLRPRAGTFVPVEPVRRRLRRPRPGALVRRVPVRVLVQRRDADARDNLGAVLVDVHRNPERDGDVPRRERPEDERDERHDHRAEDAPSIVQDALALLELFNLEREHRVRRPGLHVECGVAAVVAAIAPARGVPFRETHEVVVHVRVRGGASDLTRRERVFVPDRERVALPLRRRRAAGGEIVVLDDVRVRVLRERVRGKRHRSPRVRPDSECGGFFFFFSSRVKR